MVKKPVDPKAPWVFDKTWKIRIMWADPVMNASV